MQFITRPTVITTYPSIDAPQMKGKMRSILLGIVNHNSSNGTIPEPLIHATTVCFDKLSKPWPTCLRTPRRYVSWKKEEEESPLGESYTSAVVVASSKIYRVGEENVEFSSLPPIPVQVFISHISPSLSRLPLASSP